MDKDDRWVGTRQLLSTREITPTGDWVSVRNGAAILDRIKLYIDQ